MLVYLIGVNVNLVIMEHHGYSEDVKLMKTVANKYLTLSNQAIPETIAVELKVKVFFDDLYMQLPKIQLFYTISDWLIPKLLTYYSPVHMFILNSDFWSTGMPFVLSIPRKLPIWCSNFVEFIKNSGVIFL